MREIAESHSIGVTQVVSDGPEGDVTYHLRSATVVRRSARGPPTPRT